MPDLFSNSSGIVHMEFIPHGATVNKDRYNEILLRLCNSIRRKCPESEGRKNLLLLQDNATAHSSVLVQEELARQHVTVLPHAPYSPNLAPCKFFLFHRFKAKLHGHRFQSSKVINATRNALRKFPANMFLQCFWQLYQRWQTCIVANNYFEGRCGSV
jgi:hypothetical protein